MPGEAECKFRVVIKENACMCKLTNGECPYVKSGYSQSCEILAGFEAGNH